MLKTFALLAALVCVPLSASAHVQLTAPDDAEVIDAGASVTVSWTITVNHGPPDTYDLMFSPDGGGQYQMLADGLPSSQTSFDWTAPSSGVPNAVLSLVQHGSNGYTYMHSVSFVVSGPSGDADVGVPDAGFFDPPEAQTPIPDQGPVPTTGEEVGELLELRCAMSGCHATEAAQAGLNLERGAFPQSLVAQPSTTRADATLVTACDPSGSELLARLHGDRGLVMPPPPESELSGAQFDALSEWIDSGAPASGSFDRASCGDDESGGGCSTASGGSSSLAWLLLLGILLPWRQRR